MNVKRYEVAYSWSPGAAVPKYYSAGEYRWKWTARLQAWTAADLGWDVKIIDRKTGKVLDVPGFVG